MANVLPQEFRKKVWSMYRARFLIAFSLCVLALSLCGYLALIPSYLALRLASPALPQTENAHTTSTPSAAADINRAQLLLAALSPVLEATTSPAAFIAQSLTKKPQGVTVSNINYDAAGGKITLTGAGARESINAYRDTLSRDPTFSSVSIPVSALVGSSGQFSMTLIVAH